MDRLVTNFQKEDPFEVIEKGELIEINPETNKYRKCKDKMSPYVIGVAIQEWKPSEEIPYNINEEGYELTTKKQEPEIEVQIAGIAIVKTNGIICIGDLLVSGENGLAEAVRYKNDYVNLGKIIGKVIGVTENKDEYLVLLSNM